jgi:hypothetical protein
MGRTPRGRRAVAFASETIGPSQQRGGSALRRARREEVDLDTGAGEVGQVDEHRPLVLLAGGRDVEARLVKPSEKPPAPAGRSSSTGRSYLRLRPGGSQRPRGSGCYPSPGSKGRARREPWAVACRGVVGACGWVMPPESGPRVCYEGAGPDHSRTRTGCSLRRRPAAATIRPPRRGRLLSLNGRLVLVDRGHALLVDGGGPPWTRHGGEHRRRLPGRLGVGRNDHHPGRLHSSAIPQRRGRAAELCRSRPEWRSAWAGSTRRRGLRWHRIDSPFL